MDVSKNRGFSPQIIHGLIGFSIINPPSILGVPARPIIWNFQPYPGNPKLGHYHPILPWRILDSELHCHQNHHLDLLQCVVGP